MNASNHDSATRPWSSHLAGRAPQDWNTADMLKAAIASINDADTRLIELQNKLRRGHARAS